jgi:adenosylhomocysteine nucleosidase
MRTGIMGAMPEEVDIIREQMTEVSEVKHGSRTYYQGKINNAEVVLVFCRWGKGAAATTATSLIDKFNADQLIFTGVAGAVSSDLNIGDIVISSELYQHDLDPSPLFPKHEVPLTGLTFFKADSVLIQKAEAASKALLSNLEMTISPESLEEFHIKEPKCYTGVIASGDQFVSSKERTETILREQPQALAVEMEGALLAQVCHDHKLPFVVIRTISDKADHEAHIDFPKFIEEIARRYSESIVKYMFAH